MRVREFVRHSVTVTEPVIVNAYMKEKEYLCSLDMDKMMAGFRETAGLSKRTDRYQGGWEDKDYSGHTLGHYMVALAQVYAREKSAEIEERLEYILSELTQCQAQSGYLFTYDAEVFGKLEKGEPYKVWYTMHKVVMGLIAVYKLAGMEQALTIVKKLGDWIADRVLNWTEKQKRWTLTVADGGMNDCLYELYIITKDERYAEAAKKFEEADLFTPLSMGKDILANKHAADTIPKISGALNRYIAFGEAESGSFEIAKNFFDMVMKGHTFVTGGNGELMHFRTAGALATERTQYNSETCSTYGMMKLAERLYSVTGDKRYMDYYERAYFNAMLGAQNPENGMTAFYQPMASGYFKTYSAPSDNFWCCTGTGMEMFTNLNSSIYHTGDDGIYVNLYISSVFADKESGVKLIQMITPESYESAEFVLEKGDLKDGTLYFRVPEWCGEDIEVTVNGTAVETSVKNGYLSTERKYESGDRIVLKFRPTLTMKTLPDMEHCITVTYGPFVLAACMGQEDMTTERMRRTNVTVPTKNVTVMDRIVLKEGLKRSEWLANYKENFIKKDGKLVFTLRGLEEEKELVFMPYYKIYNERYGIYLECYDEENLPDDLLALKEEQKRLEEERLAAEAEAARLAEEERLRQEEEERKRQEEEQKRKEAERMRREEARLAVEEEERKRQEEARRIREEEYRLRRGIELQRQELQRRLDAEAEERERREDEERKLRAQEERKRREEEARRQAEEAGNPEDKIDELQKMSMEERFRFEEEERKRREEEAAAERRRREEAEEEERKRKEEERKRREEDYRLRQGIDIQRQEMELRRQEGDDGRERRELEEAERKRKAEERKRREEEYQLFKERELQRQEMERRRQEEAEEAERKRQAEAEEAKKREEEEKRRAEEEARNQEEQQLAEAERAAKLAEAKLREEEAKLLLAKLAAERAQIEATMQPTEAEGTDKKKGGLRGLFGGKKR